MSGLTRKKVTVKSRRGKTYQRSVMVRAGEKVGRFVNRHKGKLAVAGALLVGAAMASGHIRRANVRRKAANYHDTVNKEWVAGSANWAATHKYKSHEVRGSKEAKAWGVRAAGDRSQDLDYAAHHAREQSAERSGHFSTRYRGFRDVIPRLRLGSGMSPPNAAGQSDPRPTAEQRRHLNVLGHQFDRSQERLSSASGERYRSAWASGHQGVLRLGSGQVSTPKKSRSSGRKRS